MIAEDRPYLQPFDQDAIAAQRRYIDRDLVSELGRLERLRALHLAELESLSEPGWQRPRTARAARDMSIELYETHVAAEEVDHLAQIARLLQQPGKRGSP